MSFYFPGKINVLDVQQIRAVNFGVLHDVFPLTVVQSHMSTRTHVLSALVNFMSALLFFSGRSGWVPLDFVHVFVYGG